MNSTYASSARNELLITRNVLELNSDHQIKYKDHDYSPQPDDRNFYANYRNRVQRQEIKVQPYNRSEKAIKLECPPELKISSDKLDRFFQHCMSLSKDPVRFAGFLKPIEEAMKRKLQEREIEFHDADSPEFLIEGKGAYLPGPAPEGYETRKKGQIINSVLLEKEQAMEINKEGCPTFTGAIPSVQANPLVSKGYIFKEDVEISTLLLHGKNSHRLFFQALMESLKGTEFESLSGKDVLQLLVSVNVHYENKKDSFWEYVMDSNFDMEMQDLLNPSLYRFSVRSPLVLNSMLMTFGKELGLPNLMHCMLDSHWKSMAKMMKRFSPEGDRRLNYLIVMEALVMANLANLSRNFSFTKKAYDASIDRKYHLHPAADGVFQIKYKKKLSAEEEKQELKSVISEYTIPYITIQPSHHEVLIELLQEGRSSKLFLAIFGKCLFSDEAHMKELGSKILALDLVHSLQGEDKKQYEIGLQIWNQNHNKK